MASGRPLNYTTTIPVHQTVTECQSILAAAGASSAAVHFENDQPAVTALTRRNERLAGLVRAVLVLEWPLPVPTPVIEQRVSRRYDPDVYRALRRLERLGDAERITGRT